MHLICIYINSKLEVSLLFCVGFGLKEIIEFVDIWSGLVMRTRRWLSLMALCGSFCNYGIDLILLD